MHAFYLCILTAMYTNGQNVHDCAVLHKWNISPATCKILKLSFVRSIILLTDHLHVILLVKGRPFVKNKERKKITLVGILGGMLIMKPQVTVTFMIMSSTRKEPHKTNVHVI